MSEYDEANQAGTQASGFPDLVAQAVSRYVEIQRQEAALVEERHRLRDQIAAYMAHIGASSMASEVDGVRMVVRHAVKNVVEYNEEVLRERLGPDYRLILWPDPDKIKRNLPIVAPLLMPILDKVGSPSPEAVKAAIASGKLRQEQFDGAFERRQTKTFSIARARGADAVREVGAADGVYAEETYADESGG